MNQGPKKYYVHNDIFHYQDEVFSEETSDEPGDGTVGKEISLVFNYYSFYYSYFCHNAYKMVIRRFIK